tara:strand:+ start:189 stop:626 length:438 start_codon:yes stop_codon:yes gene_type:complete
MLAEIAAANAAFQVIKSAIQNGREIADVAHKVGDYVNATEDLRKKADKKKRRTGSNDLEEFMHLEKLKQQEEELKQLMIYTGRAGLWHDWIRFQAEARKARLLAVEQRHRRNKKIVEIAIISIVCILGGFGIVALIAWAMYLKSM